MHHTFTRICTCALAIAAVLSIGSQASAQGGPDVRVVNTPLPVTVTNQAMSGTPVAFNTGASSVFTVPVAQRLVIEYVSGQCGVTGQLLAPTPFIQTVTGGVTTSHFITLPTGFIPSAEVAVQFGQLVKIYADPGTNVTVGLLQQGVGCGITFSGQLVTP